MITQPPTSEPAPTERPRLPTIYDVAAAAGVAPSTVSRAFARPGRVNSETAEHIRKVAAELGYRTNPMARALPSGRTSMIALVISDITNPFYNEIIRGAETAAGEAGYTILPRPTPRNPTCWSGKRSIGRCRWSRASCWPPPGCRTRRSG